MADQGERVTFAELMRRGTLEIGDGYRAKNSELGGDGPIFMRAGRLTQSGWDWDGAERFQAELATKVEPKIAKPRDTVITTKGNSTGRTGYVPDDAPIFVYSPHLSYWRSVNPGELDARYLRYFALSPEFRSQLKAMAHGTDMAPYLSLSDQKRIELVLPGMERQQAISEVLGALDDKIAVNERIAVTYEQLLKLQVERMGLEVEPGPEEAVLVTEFVHFNPKVPKASPEAVYVDMAALSTNRAGISAWARREPKGGTRFVNGDTLLARITPCLENGKTGYVGFMEDGEIGVGSTEFIVMRSVRGIPPEFSYFLARSKRFREHAIRNMVGSSGRQRVAAVDAANFYIGRPDEMLLSEFGGMASDFFTHMRSLDRESRTLATLRDTLLPQLMSGKLRIRDAEKVVEDAV